MPDRRFLCGGDLRSRKCYVTCRPCMPCMSVLHSTSGFFRTVALAPLAWEETDANKMLRLRSLVVALPCTSLEQTGGNVQAQGIKLFLVAGA